jgi:uncharacterized protein (DUF433 family)
MIDRGGLRKIAMNDEIIYGHITSTPGICGGKPRIAGHRIKVQHIVVEHERLGMRPDEICDAHPGLTLSEVHAALAYYFDHREEVLADIDADEKLVAELLQEQEVKPAG